MPRYVVPLLILWVAPSALAQLDKCVTPSDQRLIIYRAGSLTQAFAPLVKAFTCETGIQVKDVAMGSVDAARQITAGAQACDLYAPADYLDIDLFMKPAGYANFNMRFARGRMVLMYSQKALAAKKLGPIEESHPLPDRVPKAVANWYEILIKPGVMIGGGNPFLDPGAYRAPMIFQLAEEFYGVPNLYNNLLEHLVLPSPDALTTALGRQFEFQFIYEHSARAMAAANPDYRYVDLPDNINLSDPAKDAYYRRHAIVVLPGLGTPRSARTIPVPGNHVAWGITLLKDAPNKESAIKFLQLLLGPSGTASLKANGPVPVSPALVTKPDFDKLPRSLRHLVKISAE